ncbi:uncharacterized protein B0I36DRAFT_356242 [Microdochium trichocladiopsis]|uniref:Uncharacterized protein n=1 Tax=Microdochium trichocladiopsis TaxID=1682393 RepID=A0A9P8XTK0_9PEZI|nr:uncharacterized protein B0I36DRAFT_356242 [Microdochium trichocladiopsis]KAH7012148.1 hypothetical protein B0I36DRAFT_356242 [Microdochium trichocladiopsis]
MGTRRRVVVSWFRKAKSTFQPSHTPSKQLPPQVPEILVFVDVPDIDNILCCLSVIKAHPNHRVNIVLTPRPVDFTVKPYPGPDDAPGQPGPVGRALYNIIPRLPNGKPDTTTMVRRRMQAYTTPPDWVKEIEDEEVLPYFATPDRVFEANDSNGLKKDTCHYMKASAWRIFDMLCEAGVISSDTLIRFFWDLESMEKVAPGLRHAAHVADFTYGYTTKIHPPKNETPKQKKKRESKQENAKAMLTRFQEILLEEDPEKRREMLRGYCDIFSQAMATKYNRKSILSPFDDLIAEQTTSSASFQPGDWQAVIGGPFTEALKWIEKGGRLSKVTGMAFYTKGKHNTLPNQFNVGADIWSAWHFLQKVKEKNIPFLIMPTEIAKAPEWKIKKEDLDTIFAGHEDIRTVVEEFTNQSKTLQSITLFDWITSIIARDHNILPSKPVLPYLAEEVVIESEEIVDGKSVKKKHVEVHEVPLPKDWNASTYPPKFILRVRPVDPEEGGSVRMCWDDPGEEHEIVQFLATVHVQYHYDICSSPKQPCLCPVCRLGDDLLPAQPIVGLDDQFCCKFVSEKCFERDEGAMVP